MFQSQAPPAARPGGWGLRLQAWLPIRSCVSVWCRWRKFTSLYLFVYLITVYADIYVCVCNLDVFILKLKMFFCIILYLHISTLFYIYLFIKISIYMLLAFCLPHAKKVIQRSSSRHIAPGISSTAVGGWRCSWRWCWRLSTSEVHLLGEQHTYINTHGQCMYTK